MTTGRQKDRKNPDRASDAKAALQWYKDISSKNEEDNITTITDLMADLMHLLVSDLQPEETAEDAVNYVTGLARMHFDAEHGNPEELEDEAPASEQ